MAAVTTPDQADSGPDTEGGTESELDRVPIPTPIDPSLVRRLVRAHAAALREIGLPPEQMLIRVKSIIEPPLSPGRLPRRSSPDEERLRLRITRWAVESYFDIPERDDERDGESDGDRTAVN
jgi:hypothetical protein